MSRAKYEQDDAAPVVCDRNRSALDERDSDAVGPLHRTLVFVSKADLERRGGDVAQWHYWLAVIEAVNAGLIHQLTKIKQTYGGALETIFGDLDSRIVAELTGSVLAA